MVAAGGCKSGFQKRLALKPELKISAVAVYPFGFRWDQPAYRSFELSQRLLATALKESADTLAWFGPSEFKVFRAEDDNAWAATNAVSLLPGMSLGPQVAAVLRPWAERRVQSGQQALIDKKGRDVAVTSGEEISYLGHIEVIHPSSRTVMIEIWGEAKVDPFEATLSDSSDPAPELTALMEKLTAEAVHLLADNAFAPSPAKPLEATLEFNPKLGLSYSDSGRPSLEMKLATMDSVESELLIQDRIRYANPTISDADVAKLARLPGGLFVADAPPGGKLHRGDLITLIDGLPALPQSLQRARFSRSGVSAKVRQGNGEFVELELP